MTYLKSTNSLSLAIIGLLIAFIAFSGFDTKERNAKPKSECEPSIEVEAQNVLFADVSNSIVVNVPGYNQSKIKVTLEPSHLGSIKHLKGNKYEVLVDNAIKGESVAIVASVERSGNRLSAKEFRVLELPLPCASIAGKAGATITPEELMGAKMISAGLENFIIEDIKFEVTGYDYIYTPKRGNLLRNSTKGDKIPDDLRTAFENAKRGDMLIISGVSARHNDGIERSLPGALIFSVY